MLRIVLIICACVVGLGTISGCETTKGIATGIGATANGIGKDFTNTFDNMKKADGWIKENLW